MEHADLLPASVTAILLRATSPPRASAAGYLPPGPPDRPHDALDLLILRRIPPDVLYAYPGQHRVAVWAVVPRLPYAFLGPLLRHELEHASQYQRYGKALSELNSALQEAWALTHELDRYMQLPVERQANLAAARYAAEHLRPHAIERASRDRGYRQLLDAAAPELKGDLLDLTVNALRNAVHGGAELARLFADGELDDLERHAKAWPETLHRLPHDGPELIVAGPLRR